jgi:type IV secretory pathway VirB10-like protein
MRLANTRALVQYRLRCASVADRNLLLSAGTVIPCNLQTAIN